jgi:putative membrane protein
MSRFLLRLLINAAALWAAVRLVHGITYVGGPVQLLGVALVFGAVNAVLRPILFVLSLPLLFLSLGLLTFVLNGILMLLTSSLSGALGLGFHVSGLWPAVVGAFVVSLASLVLHLPAKSSGLVAKG